VHAPLGAEFEGLWEASDSVQAVHAELFGEARDPLNHPSCPNAAEKYVSGMSPDKPNPRAGLQGTGGKRQRSMMMTI
jgi:hypothetical protein